jgi:hypothetical protein
MEPATTMPGRFAEYADAATVKKFKQVRDSLRSSILTAPRRLDFDVEADYASLSPSAAAESDSSPSDASDCNPAINLETPTRKPTIQRKSTKRSMVSSTIMETPAKSFNSSMACCNAPKKCKRTGNFVKGRNLRDTPVAKIQRGTVARGQELTLNEAKRVWAGWKGEFDEEKQPERRYNVDVWQRCAETKAQLYNLNLDKFYHRRFGSLSDQLTFLSEPCGVHNQVSLWRRSCTLYQFGFRMPNFGSIIAFSFSTYKLPADVQRLFTHAMGMYFCDLMGGRYWGTPLPRKMHPVRCMLDQPEPSAAMPVMRLGKSSMSVIRKICDFFRTCVAAASEFHAENENKHYAMQFCRWDELNMSPLSDVRAMRNGDYLKKYCEDNWHRVNRVTLFKCDSILSEYRWLGEK